ncbi:MAG: beta-lactamase family protein [Bacteroidales bacterium]|nr:beta-lactamase family protein [Bacteroidales bacterium]
MLYDEGKLDLDDKISKYLDEKTCSKIENAEQATIRQILNHTSGIYDIISDQGLYLKLLNNPNKDWSADELLECAYGKDAYFSVGEGVHYSNTNFLLASLIIEEITGKPHVDMLKERIFIPLELNNTYYHWDDELPVTTAQGYYDLHNNGTILNLSNYHTGSGNGYNGIYCTVSDLNIFIKALLIEKTLISEEALQEMLIFTEVEEETNRRLGLGIYKDFQDRVESDYALGHRGRDLQYSADLFWFPKTNTTMAFLINYGMNGESSLSDVFYEFREKLADEVLRR